MSKQTQGLAAVMPSTEELKTAGIRELSAEELLEVNGGRQVEGAISSYGPDPDIPDDPPSSSGSSSDNSSDSSGGSSGSSSTSNDSSSDSGSSETSSGSSIDSSSNTSEDTSSSSSGSDTSDDTGGYTDYPEAGYTDEYESGGSSGESTSDTGSNASEDTSSSSSSDTSNDNSSDSYEDEECGSYDSSCNNPDAGSSDSGSSSPSYEDEESGSYSYSSSNETPNNNSSNSSSSSSSYPDKGDNDSYAKNHSESSSGNSAERNRKREAYIVQKGDTLSDIVRRHYPDASSDEIRRLVKETAKNSGITDVNKLEIGQTVFFTERQDGAKTGTKLAEAETKIQSLKEQFKNISGAENTQAVSPKEIKGVTRTIKHKNNVNIKGNTGGANPQQSIETEVKYVFVQGYSQLEFDKRYKFENGGHTQSCKTVASINEAMSKEELGEEKFYKVLDNCVQLWKDNKWIDKDGSPLDLDKMNLSLAKELEKETFSGFEFIKENTEWKRKKLTSDAFVESNSYDSGIGFWETADGGKHYMAMRKCDGYIMVIDSMDITRPRAGLYTPSTVEPYTQRTVGAI